MRCVVIPIILSFVMGVSHITNTDKNPWDAEADGDRFDVIIGSESPDGSTFDKSGDQGTPASWSPDPIVASSEEPPESVDDRFKVCAVGLIDEPCVPDFGLGEAVWAEGPEDVDVVAEILGQVERELASFAIEPATIRVQPASGEVLVGMYTVFYSDAATQRFSTTMLARGVVLEVEPVRYIWDFGDGSDPWATSDPGRAYPSQTITHTYDRAGLVAPQLTTRWVGRIRISGFGGWFAVRGQATTVDTAAPIEAVSKRNRLVPADVR